VPSPRWLWLALLAVLAGAAGHAVESLPVATPPAARGAFWVARAGDGSVLAVDRERGLVIGPGDSLVLQDEDGASLRLRRVALRVERTGSQSSYVRLHFRQSDAGLYRAFVVPGSTVTASLSLAPGNGEPVELASAEVGGLPDGVGPFEVSLSLDGPRFELSLDGQSLARADDATLAQGRFTVWADGVRVRALDVEALDARGKPVSRRVDLDELAAAAAPAASGAPAALAALAEAAALALAVAGFLRSLCLRAPSWRELGRATVAALVPLSVLVAARGLAGWPLPTPLVGLLGVLGIAPAVTVLRPRLDGGTEAAQPATAARVASRRERWRSAAFALALAAGVAWTAGAARLRVIRPLAAQEQSALAAASTEGFVQDGPLRLDASNSISIPQLHRSLTLGATVTLEESSWLELRLRERGGSAQGVALFLGSDARMPTGFVEEGERSFTPIGQASGPLPARRPLRLELQVEGSRYEALVDGRSVARADERRHPVGRSVILTADGAATVADLRLVAAPAEPPVRGPARELLAAASAPLLLWLVLAAACAACLRAPRWRAPELAAWSLAPLALVLAGCDDSGDVGVAAFAAGAAGSLGVLAVLALAHGRGWRAALLPLVGLLAVPVGLRAAAGPPVARQELLGQGWAWFDVPRLEPGLAHVQHPMLRQWNYYLDSHAFRGRHFAIPKPPGTVRVMCLGTSSTWGHGIDEASGLDYPTLLGGMLRERLPELPIEVMNAGVSGASTPRLLRFLREALLDFDPDIVVFSLSFNDAVFLTRFDEHGWLTRLEEPGVHVGPIERLEAARDLDRGLARSGRFEALRPRFGEDSLAAWHAAVPGDGPTPLDRFEQSLRAVADLLQSRGIALVLVKEAQRGDESRPWKREFYDAIERIGAEHGAPVVDPKPALDAAGGAAVFMDAVHLIPRGNRAQAGAIAPVVEGLIRERTGAGVGR